MSKNYIDILVEIVDFLHDSMRKHYENTEDDFYSCPKSGNCSNDMAGELCNCGADEYNLKLYLLLKKIHSVIK